MAGWARPRLQFDIKTAGTLLSINRTYSGSWSLWAFVTGVSFPAPAYRPVVRVMGVPRLVEERGEEEVDSRQLKKEKKQIS